jgi:hypothetical protein
MVLTKRSAWALRLGERGGSFTDFTPLVQSLQKLCREQGVSVMDQVSFPDQEAFRSITEIACHLAHPEPLCLSGQSGNLHPRTRQVDEEEHQEPRQALASPGLDGEEVRSHHYVPMPTQKLLPGGLPVTFGRRFQTVFLKKVGDSTGRDFMAEIG